MERNSSVVLKRFNTCVRLVMEMIGAGCQTITNSSINFETISVLGSRC